MFEMSWYELARIEFKTIIKYIQHVEMFIS